MTVAESDDAESGASFRRGLRERAASHSLFLFMAAAAGRVVGLVLAGYLARRFDAGGLGTYNLVLAYNTMFGLLADLGVSIYVAREVAARPDEQRDLVRHASLASLALGFLAMVAANGLAQVSGYEADVVRLIAIASVANLFAPSLVLLAWLNARLHGRTVAGLTLASQGLAIVVSVYVVLARRDVETLIAAHTAAAIVSALIVVAVTRGWRFYRGRPRAGDVRAALGIAVRAAPLGVIAVVALVHARLGTVILSWIDSAQAVGFYTAAARLAEALQIIPFAVSAAVMPLVAGHAGLAGFERETVARAIAGGFRYLALLAVPLGVGGLLLAAPLVELVYGPSLAPAAGPFRVLLVAILSLFFGSVTASALIGLRMARALGVIQAITLPLYVLACVVAIPTYGYRAAAWVTLAAELTATICMLAVLKRSLDRGARLMPGRALAVALAASVPMTALILAMQVWWHAPVAVLVGAGAATYLGALIALRGVDRRDLVLLATVWRRTQPTTSSGSSTSAGTAPG